MTRKVTTDTETDTGTTNDTIQTAEPTTADLDQVMDQLKTSWTSRITVRRQSPKDIGIREVYVRLDDKDIGVLKATQELTVDVEPGPHTLVVTNQLFTKRLTFTLAVSEHAHFLTVNKAGPGTFGVAGFLLGANLIYLSLERETS